MTVWPAVLMLASLGAALTGCGVLDVWRHVWRTPQNRRPVNTGKSPVSATRKPR